MSGCRAARSRRSRLVGTAALAVLLATAAGCGRAPVGSDEARSGADGDAPAVVEDADGLRLEWLVRGDGPRAAAGWTAVLDAVGELPDGTRFEPAPGGELRFTLGAGHVIPGVEGAVARMRVGDTVRVEVPPEAGYGDRGPVPAGTRLVFEITLRELR